jgi:threonine dehydratase
LITEIVAAAARINGRVLRTPLRHSRWLSDAADGDVFLKLESLQPTFSYKIRGATNAVLKLVESGDPRPIVTASAGNHGSAMAYAARAAGKSLTVYISADAPRTKVDSIRKAGAELRACRDYDEAERAAREHGARGDAVYISPYAHPDVIAGAGTVGLEIVQEDAAVELIVASVGGGGLISGIALAAPNVRVVGAEISASTPFTQSLAAGRIVPIQVGKTIADGLTGNLDPDTPTFDLVRKHVESIVVVAEEEAVECVRRMFLEERLIVEGAAAVAIAAIHARRVDVRGRRTAVVVSGANIDASTWGEILAQSPSASSRFTRETQRTQKRFWIFEK